MWKLLLCCISLFIIIAEICYFRDPISAKAIWLLKGFNITLLIISIVSFVYSLFRIIQDANVDWD